MSRSGRRWLVPEVVQTSAMDCGPAALKGLLEGHGVPVSYGRLREACQTEVDGTSIDVLEAVAGQLGLQAEQVMVPVDHLLRPEAEALPALLVVRQPDGMTHFVVAWRRHGPLVQVMDPAVGRRWMTGGQLLDDVYPHTLAVPAEGWREWAASDDFRRPLAARLRALGVGCAAGAWIERAAADPGWRPLATLDATTRFVAVLVNAGGLKRGRPAGRLLHSLLERGAEPGAEAIIPDVHWSVRPVSAGPDGEEQVLIRGAVLVRIRGRSVADESATLSPELAAAVAEPPSRPGRVLLRWLGGAGALALLALAAGIALLAGGELVEAVLLRGVIDLGRDLTLVEQRLAA
ncbi:MAG TPA: cysteine peptidase family C39 domain-containing protein, partial [Isosphaeraceae bacterium]